MADAPTPDRRSGERREAGLRDVVAVGATAVAVVLGAAILTAVLPVELQEVVFHTPLVIAVLIGGTAVALWLVVRGR